MAYLFTPIGARIRPTFGATPLTFSPNSFGVGVNAVQIQTLTQNIRISQDSTNPAGASEGQQIKAGNDVKTIYLGSNSFTYQQETSGAVVYLQPGRWDWVEP